MSYTLNLAIQWDENLGVLFTDRRQIRRWVQSSLQRPADLTFRFVDEEEGLHLNHQYRKKKYATNVLTFLFTPPTPSNEKIDNPPSIADIVICMPVVQREAQGQGKPLMHHLAHMIVHGTLHAQGYDHVKKNDAAVMEGLEIEILRRFKIPNPYEPAKK
jgi:probable rRNA maturation factor